jgi:hypothetical protein
LTETALNLVRLLQLRLTVARFGEMDRAKWWNTKGVLSDLGEMAIISKSHFFARARIVFAVASTRCRQVFDPPKCITLWKLPPIVEEQLSATWSEWLDAPRPLAAYESVLAGRKAEILPLQEHDRTSPEADQGPLACPSRQPHGGPGQPDLQRFVVALLDACHLTYRKPLLHPCQLERREPLR